MNLRHELRAYELTNACRLASILQELTSGKGSVTRDAVATRWAQRYPRHEKQTGNNNVRNRISNALTFLKVAKIAQAQGDSIEVLNSTFLNLSAENLAIVEDKTGMAVPPASWSRRPAAPKHLLAVQEPLEKQRLEAVKAKKA